MAKSLIVGSAGQDGWFLNQHLTALDHQIWGLSRSSLSSPDRKKTSAVDIVNQEAVATLIQQIQPDQIYFLAAIHHGAEDPAIHGDDLLAHSTEIHVRAPENFLKAMQRYCPQSRFFYAASSHLFAAKTDPSPVTETTAFAPKGIYGQTKLAGVHLCRNYRQQHGLFATNGFLFNHESWRRSLDFLSRKIIHSAIQIHQQQANEFVLHDLSAQVDWSFAGDTVRAMRAMIELPEPQDFVVASGKLHSVEDFAAITFDILGLDWRDHVTEISDGRQKLEQKIALRGDASLLKRLSGWQPKVSFRQMIELMIEIELQNFSHN